MKKVISISLTLVLLFTMLSAISFSAFADDSTVILSTDEGLILTSGNYSVLSDTTVTATQAGKSGIKIEEGSTVNLYIPEKYTLTVKGADGKGRDGGGAGIWIPSTSTLNIYGGGTIVATGGNAGNGGDGQNGGWIEDNTRIITFVRIAVERIFTGEWHVQSAGGLGGDGGGGAGAGIGTPGGYGAEGGMSGYSAVGEVTDENGKTQRGYYSKIDGLSGEKAQAAAKMGTLNTADVKIDAIGGKGGKGGKGGGLGHILFFTLTGAGGGGGGGGYAATAIGTGGSSGAGGGGGGTSPYTSDSDTDDYYDIGGEGGYGDGSTGAGSDGTSTRKYSTSRIGGVGGSSGTKGAKGKAMEFEVEFDSKGGSEVYSETYIYGDEYEFDEPTKDNAEFLGWYYSEEFEGEPVIELTAFDAGNKIFYANWESTYVPIAPKVYAENGDIILNENDFDVTELSIAYIGSKEKAVSSFEEFEAAGKLYKSYNGENGFVKHNSPENNEKFSQTKNGYYAAYYCYYDDEVKKEDFAVVQIASVNASLPYITSDLNKLTLHNDYYDLDSVKLAFVGVKSVDVTDEESFILAGKQYTDVNGSLGYTETRPVSDGYIWEKEDGFYAASINYYDDDETLQSVYSVIEVNDTSVSKPYIEINDDAELVLRTNGNTVSRLSYAYIGKEEKHFMSWSTFEQAGKAFPEVNGTVGCNHVDNPLDGNKHIVEYNGYWSAFIRYDDKDGNTKKIYVTVKCDCPMLNGPHLRVNEDIIKIYTKNFPVNRVSVAYIGTEKKNINDWNSFYNAGMEYQNVNGSIGCNHYNNVPDGYTWARDDGYYAFFIRYDDENGTDTKLYQVVRVDCASIIRPTAYSEDGNLILDTKGYSVSRLSVAYIGAEEQTFRSWDAFESAGKKFANINGNIGCVHKDNPANGYTYHLACDGYWAAFMRYTDSNGITKTTYVTFKYKNDSTYPVINVTGNTLVLATNGYNVSRVSVAYIGQSELTITNWDAFYKAGMLYENINGSLGCNHYNDVPDGYTWVKSPGYYAFFIRCTDKSSNEYKLYQVVKASYTSTASSPEIIANNGKFLLNTNGYPVSRISLAYIGQKAKTISSWDSFYDAGMQYESINGYLGCNHYNDVPDGYAWAKDPGYYAFFIRYNDKSGAEIKIYKVLKLSSTLGESPEIVLDDGKFVLNSNGYNVNRISIAYIGEQEKSIGSWDAFYKAGMAYENINGSLGCKHYDDVPDGYGWVKDPGYYAFFIRYIDGSGNEIKIYRVVSTSTPIAADPEIVAIDGKLTINTNGYTVDRVSIAYIGEQEMTINNWDDFYDAGIAYESINGSLGCKHTDNVPDGYSWTRDAGYYAFFIRFYDKAGKEIKIYRVIKL